MIRRGFSSLAPFCTAALDQKTFLAHYIYLYMLLALAVNGSICIELIVSLTSWITIVGFYLTKQQ